MNHCQWQAPLVTLRDGRQVPSDSREWMEECLARHFLAMPLAKRRQALFGKQNTFGEFKGGFLQRNGEAATERLKAIMMEIWAASRSNDNSRQ